MFSSQRHTPAAISFEWVERLILVKTILSSRWFSYHYLCFSRQCRSGCGRESSGLLHLKFFKQLVFVCPEPRLFRKMSQNYLSWIFFKKIDSSCWNERTTNIFPCQLYWFFQTIRTTCTNLVKLISLGKEQDFIFSVHQHVAPATLNSVTRITLIFVVIFIVNKYPSLVFSWFGNCFRCTVLRKRRVIEQGQCQSCVEVNFFSSHEASRKLCPYTAPIPYSSWELLK